MMKSKDALPIFLAELIGTGMLMFLGCAGGLNWGHPPSHLQIVLTFGMVILVIIQIFGSVSGAHLNPAVTVSALVYKKVTAPMAGLYIAAQLCGAFMGYGLLKVLTPHSIFAPVGASYGHCMSVVHPEVSLVQAVTIEFLATAVLILIICSLWDPRNAHTLESVSLRFGFAICGLVFALGGSTGCSMNPARSLAPALWHADMRNQWIYWVGPLAGGILAPLFYRSVFTPAEQDVAVEAEILPLQQQVAKERENHV